MSKTVRQRPINRGCMPDIVLRRLADEGAMTLAEVEAATPMVSRRTRHASLREMQGKGLIKLAYVMTAKGRDTLRACEEIDARIMGKPEPRQAA